MAAPIPDVEAASEAYHCDAFRKGLYLGSCVAASDAAWLAARKITHVVNLAKELPDHFPERLKYLRLELEDNSDAV
jgi:hypothetical protein